MWKSSKAICLLFHICAKHEPSHVTLAKPLHHLKLISHANTSVETELCSPCNSLICDYKFMRKILLELQKSGDFRYIMHFVLNMYFQVSTLYNCKIYEKYV
jgi:hypothetical protein